jgi:hypothetical protein
MSDHGGRRPGAGRPKGADSPHTKLRRAAVREVKAKAIAQLKIEHPADAFDGDSIDFLRCVYRNPDFDISVRIDAAKAAARFERPTLTALAVKTVDPKAATADAIEGRVMELLTRGLKNAQADTGRTIEGALGSEPGGEA